MPEPSPNCLTTDVLWGAEAIAAEIRRPLRSTYYILEKQKLPGSKKIGGRWCFSRSAFAASFGSAA